MAFRGTIFLDEVDDIPLALQVKLLRVLQEKEFTRVGGSDKIKADIRVIAATKQNLKELIRQERFREDLYYRLNVIPIYIPPLRERPEDILSLIEFFLSSASKTYGEVKIEPNALQCLLDYEWPGNVRQLENVIKRIIVMGQGRYICKEMIPQDICDSRQNEYNIDWENMDFGQATANFEQKLLKEALRRAKNNKSQASKLLKMKPSTFRDKLAKYNLLNE